MTSPDTAAKQLASTHDQLTAATLTVDNEHVTFAVDDGDLTYRMNVVSQVAAAHNGHLYGSDAGFDEPMWLTRFRLDGVPVLVRTRLAP